MGISRAIPPDKNSYEKVHASVYHIPTLLCGEVSQRRLQRLISQQPNPYILTRQQLTKALG